MDGLVSNTALVAARRWRGGASGTIVLAGVGGLVGGAISMALGEYTSVKTQNEQLELEVAKERHELAAQRRGRARRAGRDADRPRRRARSRTPGRRPSCPPTRTSRCGCTSWPNWGSTPRRSRRRAWPRFVAAHLRRSGRSSRCCHTSSATRCCGRACCREPSGWSSPAPCRAGSRRGPWWFAGLRQLLFGAVAAGITYAIGAAIGVAVPEEAPASHPARTRAARAAAGGRAMSRRGGAGQRAGSPFSGRARRSSGGGCPRAGSAP